MDMSVPLIIALNIGAAALLALLLTALMLLPKRLHPHRHPHLQVHSDAATTPNSRRRREHAQRAQRDFQGRGGQPITDS
jgi:energy-converting hydrogenase Eha subunit F